MALGRLDWTGTNPASLAIVVVPRKVLVDTVEVLKVLVIVDVGRVNVLVDVEYTVEVLTSCEIEGQ